MLNIVLFGSPGSGKGTQSLLLQENYGLIHLSTGDICREEIERKTDDGLLAKKLIDGGNFFPDDLAYRMVESFLDKNTDAKGFIYDGIPRHIGQIPVFANMLAKRGGKVDLVVELGVEDQELIERLLERGKDSGRPDDSGKEVIEKRLGIYKEVTAPIANEYKKQGVYKYIDGTGSLNQVQLRIQSAVNSVL